jgi:hypothetical protein
MELLENAGLKNKAEKRWSQMIQILERKGYQEEAAAQREEMEAALGSGPMEEEDDFWDQPFD